MKVVGSLLLGVAVGTGVALLFSPNSGKRNRQLITKKSKALTREASKAVNDYLSKAKHGYNKVVDDYAQKSKRAIENGKELITVE